MSICCGTRGTPTPERVRQYRQQRRPTACGETGGLWKNEETRTSQVHHKRSRQAVDTKTI